MISKTIKLRKGLDIPIQGVAIDEIHDVRDKVAEVAVCPPDFCGFIPRVVVAAGDSVKVGSPLFTDKRNSSQVICSPVSGKVKSVNRGERRKLESVVIVNDGEYSSLDFGITDLDKADAAKVVELINAAERSVEGERGGLCAGC